MKYILYFILIPQILLGGYFSLIHQRGSLDVMKELRDCNPKSVYFLIPCHHTPAYSHIHQNITLRFLDCSPPLGNETKMDEADEFHLDKIKFTKNMFEKEPYPSHIVIYEDLTFLEYLKQINYKIQSRIFHSHLAKRMDSRMSNYFLILNL
jgi:GPI mannosyltransferase 3